MKRRNLLCIAAAVLLTTALLGGCMESAAQSSEGSASSSGGGKVTLWAGGSDNVRQQFQEQINRFNSINDGGYTVELQFITSGTGAQSLRDRLVAAKAAGQQHTDYDIVELGGEEVPSYLAEGGEGIFIPLDKSKITNIGDLQFPATYRDDLVMPYRGTTVVLAYNSDVVSNPPQTTAELYQWIRENPGRFAYNTPDSGGAGGSFVNTSIYNFLPDEAMTSSDPVWKAQWDEGFALLEELHPYMYRSGGKVVYPNKNQGAMDLLANKEVDIIPAWADMTISQIREGVLPEGIKISQLDPPFTGSTVVLAIPSIGSNPEGAYAFMNYMLTPEAQNIALDSMAAIPVIDFARLDEKLLPFISSLQIEEFRIMSTGELGTELHDRWNTEIATL